MTSEDKDLKEQHIDVTARLNEARLRLLIHRGEQLNSSHGWDFSDELDAIRFYLMQTHHWTPAVVRSLSDEDLEFATSDV